MYTTHTHTKTRKLTQTDTHTHASATRGQCSERTMRRTIKGGVLANVEALLKSHPDAALHPMVCNTKPLLHPGDTCIPWV
jgi:hypothetical protein